MWGGGRERDLAFSPRLFLSFFQPFTWGSQAGEEGKGWGNRKKAKKGEGMGTTTRDSASCFPLVSLSPLPLRPCKSRLLFLSLPSPRTVLSGGKSGGFAEWRPSLHCFRIFGASLGLDIWAVGESFSCFADSRTKNAHLFEGEEQDDKENFAKKSPSLNEL